MAVEKRVFGPFHQYKKIDNNSISKFEAEILKDPLYKAMKESGQDPKEIREILEVAVDAAQKKLKENFFSVFDQIILAQK